MTDPVKFKELVVAGRAYSPLLIVDADGRRTELKLPSTTSPTGTAVIQPWLCSVCAAVTTACHADVLIDLANQEASCRA